MEGKTRSIDRVISLAIILGWMFFSFLLPLCVIALEMEWQPAGWKGPGEANPGTKTVLVILFSIIALMSISHLTVQRASIIASGVISAMPLALIAFLLLFSALILVPPTPPPRIVRTPTWFTVLSFAVPCSPFLIWFLGPFQDLRGGKISR